MNPKKLTVILFFAIIVLLPALTFILPKKEKSELENRTLQKAPTISSQNLLDKTFMTESEKFMSDHFVMRDRLVKAKTLMELAQGKREVNGVFVNNEMLIEKITTPTEELTNANADAINSFSLKYKDHIDTSVMLIPTAAELYPDNVPVFADTLKQNIYISDFYGKLQNVNCIDAYQSLLTETNKYLYYRTDHHWTSYGAYVGYKSMASTLGWRAASHDLFNIEHASYDFLGTLFSKVLYGEQLVDSIDLYSFAKGDPVTEVIKYDYTTKGEQVVISENSIFNREKLNEKDKYGVFLGENQAVVKIKTNVENGKKIVLFKDSYSHALMQFLPIHYSEITLVDLRYLNRPLTDYLDISEYDQALFIYNMAGFVTDESVKKASTL